MEFLFRVDARAAVGGGHLTRCVTLAEQLRAAGAGATFLSVASEPALRARLVHAGFRTVELPTGSHPAGGWRGDAEACLRVLADRPASDRWIIVDHYGLDAEWEAKVRPAVSGLMAIDDLANRRHACEVLLDQTYGEDGARYRSLLPADCQTLFGTRYALLRPGFARERARPRAGKASQGPTRVHVFFGTADVRGNAVRFARLLLENFPDLDLRVVAGVHTSQGDLESLASRHAPRLDWRTDVADMAAHMATCEVAVGAPGMATWERACMGLPAGYVAISDNQAPILRKLASEGFCVLLGRDTDLDDDAFVAGMVSFLADGEHLAAMRAAGLAAVDGHGAERVAAALLGRAEP